MSRKIVTQIGSLPYKSIEDAIEYSLKHDIPFMPELPLLGDSMIEYIKNPGILSCLEEFTKHEFETVKIQCVGPATLMQIPFSYNEKEAKDRPFVHLMTMLSELKAKEVMVVLDEPGLGNTGIDYKKHWNEIFNPLREQGFDFDITCGVHVCGNMNWDELLDSNLDIISFDASQYADYLVTYPKYKTHRDTKRIAWGIQKKEDVKDFRKGDIITLPCGMSTTKYNVKDCDPMLKMLLETADYL